jgi:hypothetical protein
MEICDNSRTLTEQKKIKFRPNFQQLPHKMDGSRLEKVGNQNGGGGEGCQ